MTRRIRRKRRRRYSAFKVVVAFLLVAFMLVVCKKGYDYYILRQEIHQAEQVRDKLTQEKQELEKQKQDLNNPDVIGQKARKELGLVKDGEVPYVP